MTFARIGFLRYKHLVLLLAGIVLLAAGPAGAGTIKVAGGGASMTLVFFPVAAPFEKATGIHLVNLKSTSKDGLVSLLKGEVDAAVSAVPLEGTIRSAEKEGVKVDAGAFKAFPVATNRTVLLVHKDNPVEKLTKDQIKGIFTGKILNWKEVGGKDLPIIVVWGNNTSGQNATFSKAVLDNEPVLRENMEVTDYAKIKEAVCANVEAVGIDPLGMAKDCAKPIETDPPVSNPIIVITKGDPSPEVRKLIDYIQGEGKQHTIQ